MMPFLPSISFSLGKLIDVRASEDSSMGRRLTRAVEATGQHAIRILKSWEDTVTMAAMATIRLLRQSEGAISRLRYLLTGTETGLDGSKALSAYLLGLLRRAGVDVPPTLSTAQVQHACAGGTVALLSLAALLATGSGDDCGVTVCSDIAHYSAPSSGEITQGAGAVAMLLRKDPRLLEIELGAIGHASKDVDDFFRPLGSRAAVVKGPYSVYCYHSAFRIAFTDYCKRSGQSVRDVLESTDLFALHTPFPTMAVRALHNLLAEETDMDSKEISNYIDSRGIRGAVEPLSEIGNIYSGSVFLVLYFLLHQRYQAVGEKIAGQRVLICSYGSGYTMSVVSAVVGQGAASLIAGWDPGGVVGGTNTGQYEQYARWMQSPYAMSNDALNGGDTKPRAGECYLASIRQDGYREYAIG